MVGHVLFAVQKLLYGFLMVAGQALKLTELGKGKHHIGDFLPPKELEKFLEKVQAIKEGRDPGELLITSYACCHRKG